MTTFEKIENLLKTEKEGIFNIPYSSPQEKERFLRTKNATECSRKKIAKTKVKDDYVELEIINVEDFFEGLFDRIDEYIKNQNREKFEFDKNSELTKYPEVLQYFTAVKSNINRRIYNTISKGWKVTFEDTDNGFILTKKFIAVFSARIINKENIPYAVITPLTKGSFSVPNMRGFQFKDGKVITHLKNLYSFTVVNKIKDENILIEPESIDICYRYDDTYFVNSTPKQVEKWWNYDCPNLCRVIINKDDSKSFVGLYMNCFENQLVEATWNAVYIGDDITEEEIEKFAGNYKHTAIYSQMQKVLKARKTTEEEKQKEIKEVEDFEENLQKVIDENKIRILTETVKQVNPLIKFKEQELKNLIETEQTDKAFELNVSFEATSSDKSREQITDNDSMEEILKKVLYKGEQFTGKDCGFAYIKPTGSMLEKVQQIAEYNTKRMKTGALKIRFPWDGQSNIIKRFEMTTIVQIAKEHGINISYYMVLD